MAPDTQVGTLALLDFDTLATGDEIQNGSLIRRLPALGWLAVTGYICSQVESNRGSKLNIPAKQRKPSLHLGLTKHLDES